MPLALKVNKKRGYIKGTHRPSGETFNIYLGDSNHATAQLVFEGDRDTFQFEREKIKDPIILEVRGNPLDADKSVNLQI